MDMTAAVRGTPARGTPALAEAMVGVVHRHLATVGPRLRRLLAAVLLVVIVYGLGTWFFPKSVPRFTFLAAPTTYHTEAGIGCFGPTTRWVDDTWVDGGTFWRLVHPKRQPWTSACI